MAIQRQQHEALGSYCSWVLGLVDGKEKPDGKKRGRAAHSVQVCEKESVQRDAVGTTYWCVCWCGGGESQPVCSKDGGAEHSVVEKLGEGMVEMARGKEKLRLWERKVDARCVAQCWTCLWYGCRGCR